jgi:hypothetical protein
MSTFKRYVVIQAMTFAFGIVGPIILIGYFAAQPDPTLSPGSRRRRRRPRRIGTG